MCGNQDVVIVPFDEFEEILSRILMEDREILDRLEKNDPVYIGC